MHMGPSEVLLLQKLNPSYFGSTFKQKVQCDESGWPRDSLSQPTGSGEGTDAALQARDKIVRHNTEQPSSIEE